MARQTMTIFSTHDTTDAMSRLSSQDIDRICRFYQGRSSRQGALNDSKHTVGAELLRMIQQPTLVVHSREDNSVPVSHAEWSLKNIPYAELCEAGFTGHFFWIGPDFPRINLRMEKFLKL
jgi:pimeloyl-ACP methyl ester carboxylesterase